MFILLGLVVYITVYRSIIPPDTGATAFDFTIPDTNAGGNERTIKVVCDSWSVSFTNNEFHNIQTTFRRVYEP